MLIWNFDELPSCTKKLLVKLEIRLILKIIWDVVPFFPHAAPEIVNYEPVTLAADMW